MNANSRAQTNRSNRSMEQPDFASVSQKRTAQCSKASIEKKLKTALGSSHITNTEQLPIISTQVQTYFRSPKVADPMIRIETPATTIEQLVTRSTDLPQAFSSPHSLESIRPYDHGYKQSTWETTIDRSPLPIDISYIQEPIVESIHQSKNALPSSPVMKPSNFMAFDRGRLTPFEIVGAIYDTHANDNRSESSDAYPLDDGLTDADIDHESRSAAEYDPYLKFSPPDPQEPVTTASKTGYTSATWQTEDSEDLLDEDVDWNAVLTNVNAIQKDLSVDFHSELKNPKHEDTDICSKSPSAVGHHFDKPKSQCAFVRPPFPEKVRDRPSVPGMSSDTLLRTCFRIGVLISQTASCFNHQQDVVFELYGRVTYSSRETLVRKQHFQFVDLCKDQQPYPAATLTNWKAGSQLDKDSAVFLDTNGGPRLCWCMCKPMRDPKAAIGWTYTVLVIKEIDWEQVHWAQKIICGNFEESPEEIAAAKS
ncbi:hypothetical protein GGS24DRAFT_488381 [Hypoxylon argillaceum]|nr:hypothetical protein GGS24DRAFT_488381 [Hypoxylon argillaceum]